MFFTYVKWIFMNEIKILIKMFIGKGALSSKILQTQVKGFTKTWY